MYLNPLKLMSEASSEGCHRTCLPCVNSVIEGFIFFSTCLYIVPAMVSIDDPATRRKVLASSGALLGGSLAGCTGGIGGGGGGGGSGDAETFEVGHGDYQTTVSSNDFPSDKLYIYAVQTGWSNWGAVMESFQEEYGIELNDDQRSSGEALQHIRSNANNPTHSAYNGGYSFGVIAMNEDFTTDYKPANWDKVPDNLKTDNGHVTATRRMTTALTYRKDIWDERGIEKPETWDDLLQEEIMQDLVFQPPEAAVGLAGALSINRAYGGDLDNVQPVIDYYTEAQELGAQFSGNNEPNFTAGEISAMVEYDYTGLDLKYNADEVDEEQVEVALLSGPDGEPGAMNNPYGYAMLDGGPNTETAKLFMDYVLSLEGQQHFFDAFVRPIRADEMDAPDEFPAQSEYDRTEFAPDIVEMVDKQEGIINTIGEEVGITGY